MRKITAVVVSAVAAGALALTGCGASDDKDGDPGKVVDRERDYSTSTKTYDYDLEIRRTNPADIEAAGGDETYEIDVTSGSYDHCYRGSSYPKCVDR